MGKRVPLLEDHSVKAFMYLCEVFGKIADNLDKDSLLKIFQAYQEYRRIYSYQPPQKAREMFWKNFQIISPIKLPSGYIEDNLLNASPQIEWLCMKLITSRLTDRYRRIIRAIESYG